MLAKNPMEILTFHNFDKLMRYSEDYPGISTGIAVEYVPHAKINSVAADETPYRRDLPGNALVLVQWEENTPDFLAMGMKTATELGEMVKAHDMEYGNYSSCRLSRCRMFILMVVMQVRTLKVFLPRTYRPSLIGQRSFSASTTRSSRR